MIEYVTWPANVLILIGMVLVGNRRRVGFLFSIGGETLWAAYATRG